MKNLVLIITGVILLGAGTVQAQKIGHVNSQEVLFGLPDYKNAEAKMKEFTDERMKIYNTLKAKLDDQIAKYNKLKADVNANQTDLKILEAEIMETQKNIENFEQEYQKNLQDREQLLMEPLIKKVKDAIAKVAKAQGINYVVDTNTLLFMDGGNDLTPLVNKELAGPTAPANPATPAKTTGGK